MVTRILFDPRRDLTDGTTSSSAVTLEATPTGVREDGSVVVLPSTLSFTVNTAADLVQLAAPAASWAWRLVARQDGVVKQQRTVRFTDVTSIKWAELVDVDPATLGESPGHARQWDATFFQLVELIASATGDLASLKTRLDAITTGAPGAFDTFLEVATQLGLDETTVTALTALVAGKEPAGFSDATRASLGATFSPLADTKQAQQYRTVADGSQQLAHIQPAPFAAANTVGATPVFVNPADQFQPILGFGAALTGSAAYCLWHYLTAAQRTALLTDLFSPTGKNWSMLRIGIGSTDFNADPQYTYDDGGSDPTLANFSVQKDGAYIIPIIREILAINPRVRILACPWTIPAWMKATNPDFLHGTPDPAQFSTLAQYMVKFVQAYRDYGIPIWAVTAMNEPLGHAYSLTFSSANMANYVGNYLGPAFAAANLDVQIIGHDESWGGLGSEFSDSAAGPYYDGIGWHAYGGNPSHAATAHRQYPGKAQHFTEMRNMIAEDYSTAVGIMAGDVVIGSLRNWGSSVTLWNLALDQVGAPNSGTVGRQGVVTIPNDSSGAVVRNTGYWALSHVAPFLQPGARRCASTTYSVGKGKTALQTVAFVNPDQSVVLFAYNPGAPTTFQIGDGRTGQMFPVTMATDELSTFVWGTTKQNTPGGVAPTISVPAAPTITATGGPNAATVTITPGSPGGAPIAEYRIYRGPAGGTRKLLTVLPGKTTTYTDSVAPGSYDYSVRAVNLAGPGAASATTTATATTPVSVTPPTFDAASTGQGNPASVAHTVGSGANRLLVVAVATSSYAGATPSTMPAVSSITYGGVALTHLGSSLAQSNGSDAALDRQVDLFYLVAPASGTANIAVTVNTSSTTVAVNGISFSGVNQANPFGIPTAAGGGSVNSLTATPSRSQGDVLLAAASVRGSTALTPGATQTARWSALAGTNVETAGTTQTAAGGSSFSWPSADRAAMVAVSVQGI